jgi:glycosyltransferase involved in cell wall biosynthesis
LLGLPIDKKIIAYTAGTHYDSDLLLRTVYKIQKIRKDVVLVTTGAIFGNELKGKVYDLERVIEYGFMPYKDYTTLLSAVDVFLFPFSNKTLNKGRWPNKVGDYMAAGRPTVSNPTGDMVNLFQTHKIGLLAYEDPDDFANKTLTLLNNEDLLAKIGKRAREVAEEYYDWKLMAKSLERCFIKVIKNNAKMD